MTVPDLPVEGPRPWPGTGPTTSTQPASQGLTETRVPRPDWTVSPSPMRTTRMPGRRSHLQVVGGRRFWVRPEPRMQVATRPVYAGPHQHRVSAMTTETQWP